MANQLDLMTKKRSEEKKDWTAKRLHIMLRSLDVSINI